MNLCLKDQITTFNIEIAGHLEGLLRSSSNASTLNQYSKLAHEVFALVLMKVEKPSDVSSQRIAKQRLDGS